VRGYRAGGRNHPLSAARGARITGGVTVQCLVNAERYCAWVPVLGGLHHHYHRAA
jgi:hypothetical protein